MAYKKNFLDKVIVRCDFLDPFGIENDSPEELKKTLRRMGPVEKMQKKLAGEIRITPEGVDADGNVSEMKVWIFTDKDLKRNIAVSKDFFYIEYDKYIDFEHLKQDFHKVREAIQDHLGVFTVKRLGLRFIDIFEIGEDPPLNWDKYIQPAYLVTTEENPAEQDREYLSRAFNRKEFSYPDARVVLQYGIHNPGYPSPINFRQYILDTDVSSSETLEIEELEKTLVEFYGRAKSIFESAITEELRGVLRDG